MTIRPHNRWLLEEVPQALTSAQLVRAGVRQKRAGGRASTRVGEGFGLELVEQGLGLPVWRASSHSPAQPPPIQPHLQTELCRVRKPSELPGTGSGCLRQWAALPVSLRPPLHHLDTGCRLSRLFSPGGN